LMHNIIICGSGRSGTSMVAGLFANAGYFMGGHVHDPDRWNAKGYFESVAVNSINEEILSGVIPTRPRGVFGRVFFRHRLGDGERWLARIAIDQILNPSVTTRRQMCELTKREPFCFKDPRFSYTLPCWRPYLKEPRVIVVFRSPADTSASILRICRTRRNLQNLGITRADALHIWELMYSHILNMWKDGGSWLFLHYNQVLTTEGLDRIQEFTQAPVDRRFPSEALRHSCCNEPIPPQIAKLYQRLCNLACYEGDPDQLDVPTGGANLQA